MCEYVTCSFLSVLGLPELKPYATLCAVKPVLGHSPATGGAFRCCCDLTSNRIGVFPLRPILCSCVVFEMSFQLLVFSGYTSMFV